MSPLLQFQWFLMCFLMLSSCSTSQQFDFPRLGGVDPKFVVEYLHDQTLDHFSYTPHSYNTFKQRYVINSQYWGGASNNAPIFAFFGAEAPLGDQAYNAEFFSESGDRFKALLLYMEHRFYGNSTPLANVSQQDPNFTTVRGYFDSAQALADYAEIILRVKKDNQAERCPVIVFGGSYGGMLASWFRLKYPHIALGALASSAPILNFDNITDEHAYFQIVSDNFLNSSKTCFDTIKKSWNEIARVASQPTGLQTLASKFNTCYRLNTSSDLSSPLWAMYTDAAQYNDPFRQPVDAICKAIDGTSSTDILDKLAAGVFAYNKIKSKTCSINQLSSPPLDWAWQRCTEMVFPFSVGNNAMFPPSSPFDLKKVSQQCNKTYGVFPRSDWGTTYFGGHNISLVLKRFGSNIVFTNGLKDPYSAASVLKDISSSIKAVNTENGSHCVDLWPTLQQDPQWLTDQRKTAMDNFQQWIDEYNNDIKTNNLPKKIRKVMLRNIA